MNEIARDAARTGPAKAGTTCIPSQNYVPAARIFFVVGSPGVSRTPVCSPGFSRSPPPGVGPHVVRQFGENWAAGPSIREGNSRRSISKS